MDNDLGKSPDVISVYEFIIMACYLCLHPLQTFLVPSFLTLFHVHDFWHFHLVHDFALRFWLVSEQEPHLQCYHLRHSHSWDHLDQPKVTLVHSPISPMFLFLRLPLKKYNQKEALPNWVSTVILNQEYNIAIICYAIYYLSLEALFPSHFLIYANFC